jgi:hypothetical protein
MELMILHVTVVVVDDGVVNSPFVDTQMIHIAGLYDLLTKRFGSKTTIAASGGILERLKAKIIARSTFP